ncbi:MAG: hypothetical protein JNL05_00515 [Flavobacteriales bacterium]|nr:hypothetical protein [Flavobacteriales bacterium]
MATKQFIGHGKKHTEFDIIDVVVAMEKATPFIYEYEGKHYLKFSVASRREASNYGATHAVYVRQPEQQPVVAEPAAEPRKGRRKKAGKA